jgi:hypothetical protein
MRRLAIAIVLGVTGIAVAQPVPPGVPAPGDAGGRSRPNGPSSPSGSPGPGGPGGSGEPGPASEPTSSTDASALFLRGRELAKDGRFDEACAVFDRSYQLDPAPGTGLNLADCLERRGQLGRAWQLFDRVARSAQGAPSRARFARQRADALAVRLAQVTVKLAEPRAAGLVVQLGEIALSPALAAAPEVEIAIEPRDVELVATAPGRRPYRRVVHAVAGIAQSIEIPALTALDDPADRRRRRSRVYLAAGLGTAGAIGWAGSAGFAIAARRSYDSAFEPGQGCERTPRAICAPAAPGRSRIDLAGRRADLATGLAIAGAVMVGAAATVLWTAPLDAVQVAPLATRRELGLGVVGRF